MKNREAYKKIKEGGLLRAVRHEDNESYEMAYLSLWFILEKGITLYANEAVKIQLREKIKNWDDFLSGKSKKQPRKINDFTLQYTRNNIPPVSLVEKSLGKMSRVAKVLDPSEKWRRKRNNIAHDAISFSSEDKYKEYKHELLLAIDELTRKVGLHATKKRT